METIRFLDLIQALAISLFIMLATYLAFFRSSINILRPFMLVVAIEAFFSYAYFLMGIGQGDPAAIPTLLRLRWAALALLPGLFLRIFSCLARGKLQSLAHIGAYSALALGAITGATAFLEPTWIAGAVSPFPARSELLDPIFHSTGAMPILLWVAPAIMLGYYSLVMAAREATSPNLRLAARRLTLGWSLFLLASILGAMAIGLLGRLGSEWSLLIRVFGRTLTMIAIVVLARAIILTGSPIRRPLRSIHWLALFALAMIALASYLLQSDGNLVLALLGPSPLLLVGLIPGMLLAHYELPKRIAQWLGAPHQDETHFTARLHHAWENLAQGSFNIAQVSEMLLALQERIQAEYVGVLELMEVSQARLLTFGRWQDGPRFSIHAHHCDWPLTEETLRQASHQSSNLPGPPLIIFPVHDEQNLVGILLIGRPLKGYRYSAGDLRLADLLAGQLSFAITHGLQLEETLGMPRSVQMDLPLLPRVNIAVRTFGRLEIYTQHGESRASLPSLRARQILALLLAAYPDPLPAESLMEHLWPEQPFGAAANSLYVAIYALRRILEPELHRGVASRYLRRQGDCYGIVVDENLWVDFLEFEKLYAQGKTLIDQGDVDAALQTYERALRIYRRPFLAEAALDLPAEIEATRHRLQNHLHEIAWYLTQRSLEGGNWLQAERALLQLLAVDPLDQAARAELVRIYRQQGKQGLAEALEAQAIPTEG